MTSEAAKGREGRLFLKSTNHIHFRVGYNDWFKYSCFNFPIIKSNGIILIPNEQHIIYVTIMANNNQATKEIIIRSEY